jgi:hypothetical protein
VLKTGNVERLLAFYRALGIGFVEEQHGRGPLHYSASLGAPCSKYTHRPGRTPRQQPRPQTTVDAHESALRPRTRRARSMTARRRTAISALVGVGHKRAFSMHTLIRLQQR